LFQQLVPVVERDDDSEVIDELEDIERDEFRRIARQQTWIKRLLRMMPTYIFTGFNISAFETYAVCIQLWKKWRRFRLIILQDNHKGPVMRCKFPDVPS